MAKADNTWGKFVEADQSVTTNVIGTSQGPGGSGKSHFWLTAPDPIAYFLLDPGGLKGLPAKDEFKHKDIRVLDLSKGLDFGRLSREERVARGLEIMEEFDEQWTVGLRKARTIIVDKEDLLWETKRYAHDEVDSPKPLNFGELNLWYRALYAQAEAAGVHMGMVRGTREEWGKLNGGKQGFTGRQLPRGHKEAVELAQVNLAHSWDDEAGLFTVKILDKCRLGDAASLLGKEYPGLDFEGLWGKLFPDDDYEELWG